MISDVYTSTDTVLCRMNFTAAGRSAFQSLSTGETCPQRIESNAARRSPGLTIGKVSVQGSSAVASVTTKNGGSFRFDLVNQGGNWKISGISR